LTFNDYIANLFYNKLFNDICHKYGHENYEDLKSEVICILCELPEEKKNRILENDYLLPYAIQTARNQTSKRNWTKFRKLYDNREKLVFTEEFQDLIEELDETIIVEWPLLINKIREDMKEQSNKYFYHSRLLYELIESGKNTKQLSREIGIPYTSVRHALNEYRTNLKEWLNSAL